MAASKARQTEPARDIDIGILKDIIGFRLRRIQNHLSRGFSMRMKPAQTKPGAFSALALIAANPGLSQSLLSAEIGFDKATVVAIIDNLEKLGWARRDKALGDRRRHSLYATDKGHAALEDMLVSARGNEAQVRNALTPAEFEQLFGLLDKIYAACFDPDA